MIKNKNYNTYFRLKLKNKTISKCLKKSFPERNISKVVIYLLLTFYFFAIIHQVLQN